MINIYFSTHSSNPFVGVFIWPRSAVVICSFEPQSPDCPDYTERLFGLYRMIAINECFDAKCSGKLQDCSQNTSEIIGEICGIERMGYRKRVKG